MIISHSWEGKFYFFNMLSSSLSVITCMRPFQRPPIRSGGDLHGSGRDTRPAMATDHNACQATTNRDGSQFHSVSWRVAISLSNCRSRFHPVSRRSKLVRGLQVVLPSPAPRTWLWQQTANTRSLVLPPVTFEDSRFCMEFHLLRTTGSSTPHGFLLLVYGRIWWRTKNGVDRQVQLVAMTDRRELMGQSGSQPEHLDCWGAQSTHLLVHYCSVRWPAMVMIERRKQEPLVGDLPFVFADGRGHVLLIFEFEIQISIAGGPWKPRGCRSSVRKQG